MSYCRLVELSSTQKEPKENRLIVMLLKSIFRVGKDVVLARSLLVDQLREIPLPCFLLFPGVIAPYLRIFGLKLDLLPPL